MNLPQENSTSDLDDSFQNCHGNSDNRRKARCKRLKRKNLELFKVLKRSETQLGISKQDCMDLNRVYKDLKIEAQHTRIELEDIEEITRKSITDCAELKRLFKGAISTYRDQRDCYPSFGRGSRPV